MMRREWWDQGKLVKWITASAIEQLRMAYNRGIIFSGTIWANSVPWGCFS